MRQLQYILYGLLALFLAACSDVNKENPYNGQLHTLSIHAVYPDGYLHYAREGVTVNIEDIDKGYTYTAFTDASGVVSFELPNGVYRVLLSDKISGNIFNGTADKVRLVDQDINLSLSLTHSGAGKIIIKEIYCGGCMKHPEEGTYQSDKYIILHNNDSQVQYLDSLCFGTLDPYNSQANNIWISQDPETGESIFQDFVPVIQAIWQFGGTGTSFPLQPGEDAILVVCGAIDHAAQYPLSVNLNREDAFVCYSPVYFWNTIYHPAPGDKVQPDRYLDVVIKVGQANAYTFSIYSPATVIFKAKDTTIQDYLLEEGSIVQKPGSSFNQIVKIPLDWVLDGAEIFYGGSSKNTKRIPPVIDAGYVTQSELYSGRTLHRYVDEEESALAGYEILVDTNNSSNDFYERDKQSLHD